MKVNNADIVTRIQEETQKLILEYGVKGWTMDTVCKRSGLAKDTLYRIIGNKEDLVKNVFVKVLDEHNQAMSRLLLKQEQDFFVTLQEIFTLLSVFLSNFPMEKLSQVFLEYPSVEKEINDGMSDFFKEFEQFLVQGKHSGALKENVDPELFINIMHACIMQIIKQPDKFDAAEDTKTFLGYLIDGIRA